MSNAAGFLIADQDMDATPLHYTLCGLDDIYLLNGFKRRQSKRGPGVAIVNADELHKVIGAYLIRHRKALGPKDIRFLRSTMDISQSELGTYLGVDSQTVARYEKGETEKLGSSDLAIRLVFARLALGEENAPRAMVEVVDATRKLADTDELSNCPEYFISTRDGWNITTAPDPAMLSGYMHSQRA